MRIIQDFVQFLLKADKGGFWSLMEGDHFAGRYAEEILLKKPLMQAGKA